MHETDVPRRRKKNMQAARVTEEGHKAESWRMKIRLGEP